MGDSGLKVTGFVSVSFIYLFFYIGSPSFSLLLSDGSLPLWLGCIEGHEQTEAI